MTLPHQVLSSPHPVSSLAFAHKKANKQQRPALQALYTLHKKWREASVYDDPHQAITTLNWWHHELEQAQTANVNHPALVVLRPYLKEPLFFNQIQNLLHGHMHWHHLTRINTLADLKPIIESISVSYINAWQILTNNEINTNLSDSAAAVLWWVDQTRHIGHHLTPSRLWLPMSWLKELNLPAQLLFHRKDNLERIQQGKPLVNKLIQTAEAAVLDYHAAYNTLSNSNKKSTQSLNTLVQQRSEILKEIKKRPQDVWVGLISINPLRKWWISNFTH